MVPPKYFDNLSPEGECSEGLDAFRFFLSPFGGSQSCLWFTAKINKDERSAQAVHDEASLSPAATRAGFSTAPRP